MLKRPASPPTTSNGTAINGHTQAKKNRVQNLDKGGDAYDNDDDNNGNMDEGVDEDDDDDVERLASNDPLSMEPPALYPKSGYGLARQLRPESEDIDILVDDNQEVYTHVFQADAKVANEGIFGVVEESAVEAEAKAEVEVEAKTIIGQEAMAEG